MAAVVLCLSRVECRPPWSGNVTQTITVESAQLVTVRIDEPADRLGARDWDREPEAVKDRRVDLRVLTTEPTMGNPVNQNALARLTEEECQQLASALLVAWA